MKWRVWTTNFHIDEIEQSRFQDFSPVEEPIHHLGKSPGNEVVKFREKALGPAFHDHKIKCDAPKTKLKGFFLNWNLNFETFPIYRGHESLRHAWN